MMNKICESMEKIIIINKLLLSKKRIGLDPVQ